MSKYKYGWECLYKAATYLSKNIDDTLEDKVGSAVRNCLTTLDETNDLPEDMRECFKSFKESYNKIPAEDAAQCILDLYVRICHHNAPNSPEFNKFKFDT